MPDVAREHAGVPVDDPHWDERGLLASRARPTPDRPPGVRLPGGSVLRVAPMSS
jgi:hypothetical protein